MIWLRNYTLWVLLFATYVVTFVSSQNTETSKLANDDVENINEDNIDLTPSIESTEDDPDTGPNVGKPLLPPLLGQGLLPGQFNLFSLMFPALNSLLLWRNLFPAPQLLGSTQQMDTSLNDESPSASKVVLVLAEDPNPHLAMRAANQEAARTIRQSDIFSQFLSQINQADFGQILSQSFEQMQQQDPGQVLQQIFSPDLSQSIGQMLSQTMQQLPIMDLGQFPILGQAPISGEPTTGAALEQAQDDGATSNNDAAPASPPAFQFPNFQSAIDAGTQILGQAFQQPSADSSSAFQFPNFQSTIDAGSQMIGQAFQQAAADPSSGGFQLPNIQSVIDSGSQMLSQSAGLFNLRPLQSGPEAEASASQISEVSVKPGVISTAHIPSEQNKPSADKIDDYKMVAALQKALVLKQIPLLWFHIPSASNEKDHDFDLKHKTESVHKNVNEMQLKTKLKAFQRQVMSELKLLQDIERKAKEMRGASMGVMDKDTKDTQNHYTSLLSKMPFHKITRTDLKKALNDDYVRNLLQKAAIANQKEAMKTSAQKLYMPNGAQVKRQTMTSAPTMSPKQMTREDIVRLMAYAYRMANANGVQMLESSDNKKFAKEMNTDSRKTSENSKSFERQWATDPKTPSQMTAVHPMYRQWIDEQMPIPERKSFEQNEMSSKMGRQWFNEEKRTATDKQKFINADPKQLQKLSMLEKQRQAIEPMPQTSPQQIINERQRVDQEMGTQSWMQANTRTPMQRQWIDANTPILPSQISRQQQMTFTAIPVEGRMWAEQRSPMTMQQPQMAVQKPGDAWQQTEMVMQQLPMKMQQQPMVMQQPQLAMQQPEMIMQQPQLAMQHPKMVMQQQSMDMQQPAMVMQESPVTAQQHQGDMMILQQTPPDMQQHNQDSANILGEATPQMPENAEKARFKGGSIFDELDLFGLGGGHHKKSKNKGKPHGLTPTVNNYYYNNGGRGPSYDYGGHSSSYRPNYGGNSEYPSGYGGIQSGYSSYTAPHNGYYRMAVGEDEIRAMLKEHSPMKTLTKTYSNPPKAKQVPTTTFQSTTPGAATTHSSKDASSNEHLEKPSNFMDTEEVASIFSFSPSILEPFMGLQPVPVYKSDPWNHKPYDLHYPLYEGGGSYESYLNNKRLKRNTHFYTNNILTPSILDNFLKIRVQFEKSFPQLYKSLRDQQRALNLTRVPVKPPVIPKEVEYPPTELGAAEMLSSDSESIQITSDPAPKNDDAIDHFFFDD